MLAQRKGQFELSSDAISPGDQHWVFKALGHLKKGAKAPNASKHLRPHRGPRKGFDAIHQGIPRINIDPRISVGHRNDRGFVQLVRTHEGESS